MASFNQAIIIRNFVRDPERKYTTSGTVSFPYEQAGFLFHCSQTPYLVSAENDSPIIFHIHGTGPQPNRDSQVLPADTFLIVPV
jgi:hypothetical protein